MPKKSNAKSVTDLDLNNLDLDLDGFGGSEAINEGRQAGINLGLKAGAKETFKPIAEQAAKKALNEIVNPKANSDDPYDDAMRAVTGGIKLQSANEVLRSLQNNNATAQQPPSRPETPLDKLTRAGISTDRFTDDQLIALLAPEIAPYLTMMKRTNSTNGGGNDNSLMATLLPMILNQQHTQQPLPQAPPQNDRIFDLIIAMMDRTTQQIEKLVESQNKMFSYQIDAINNKINSVGQRPDPPSFVEQLTDFSQNLGQLRQTGFLGGGGDKTDHQADLEYNAQIRAMDIEKEKTIQQMNHEEKQYQIAAEKENQNLIERLVGMGTNFLKNFKMEVNPQAFDQNFQSPAAEVQNTANSGFTKTTKSPSVPKPLSRELSTRVNNMMRGVRIVPATPKPTIEPDEYDGDEDD